MNSSPIAPRADKEPLPGIRISQEEFARRFVWPDGLYYKATDSAATGAEAAPHYVAPPLEGEEPTKAQVAIARVVVARMESKERARHLRNRWKPRKKKSKHQRFLDSMGKKADQARVKAGQVKKKG